jgi:hypothetical protein
MTPLGDQAGCLPLVHRTRLAAAATTHPAVLAMGGYGLPSRSMRGSQSQRWSSGTSSMTVWTWAPQPHQDVFSAVPPSVRRSGVVNVRR